MVSIAKDETYQRTKRRIIIFKMCTVFRTFVLVVFIFFQKLKSLAMIDPSQYGLLIIGIACLLFMLIDHLPKQKNKITPLYRKGRFLP